MNKNLLYLLFAIVFFVSCIVTKKDKESATFYEEIKGVAISELPQFLDNIPAGSENLYGFNNRDEIRDARVGNPFVFFVEEGGAVRRTDTYRLPVIVNETYKAFATVESVDGNYHVVDFGATQLAKEVQGVCNNYSTKKFEGILRVYNTNIDFVVFSENNNFIFVPLSSAKVYLVNIGVLNVPEYYTNEQIIKLIKK